MLRQFSAGGVVFKKEKGKIFWLLVQPAINDQFRKSDRWQLPKGLLEKGEKSAAAALREVEEEGGVKANILAKIDVIKIFFKNSFEENPPAGGKETIFKTIVFYLMEYLEDVRGGHDWEVGQVSWFPFKEATEKLSFKSEKQILEKAQKLLINIETQPTFL